MLLRNVGNPVRLVVLGLVALILCGCVKPVDQTTLPTEHTVTLYDGEEVLEVFVVGQGESIELPILDNQDDRIFAAWTDQEAYFSDRYEVVKSVDLHAYFEVAAEIFDYTSFDSGDSIYIEGYRGITKHLTIPQKINDLKVVSIGPKSFEESKLVSVRVPIEATIQTHAFLNSRDLKSVSFYGRYLDYDTMEMSKQAYLGTLASYSDACQIVSGSVESGTWSFGEGCPIRTVLRKTSIIVGDIEYVNYRVLWDLNVENTTMRIGIQSQAFYGADNLERVTLSKDESFLMADAFGGCPKLTDIVIPEENDAYAVVDQVVYSKDLKTLVLYPNGLTQSVFAVPESVTTIRSHAFMENTAIQELILPASIVHVDLAGMFGLETITVDPGHPALTVVDGVLFEGLTLIKYPAMKPETTYVVPSHITTLSGFAFQGNQFLTTLTLNEGLKTIGDQCFRQTMNLLTVDLPASVEYLRAQVFVESSVKTLIVRRSFVVHGSITIVFLQPLFTMTNEFTIYVPDDSVSTYVGNWTWSQLSDRIEAMSNLPEAE